MHRDNVASALALDDHVIAGAAADGDAGVPAATDARASSAARVCADRSSPLPRSNTFGVLFGPQAGAFSSASRLRTISGLRWLAGLLLQGAAAWSAFLTGGIAAITSAAGL